MLTYADVVLMLARGAGRQDKLDVLRVHTYIALLILLEDTYIGVLTRPVGAVCGGGRQDKLVVPRVLTYTVLLMLLEDTYIGVLTRRGGARAQDYT